MNSWMGAVQVGEMHEGQPVWSSCKSSFRSLVGLQRTGQRITFEWRTKASPVRIALGGQSLLIHSVLTLTAEMASFAVNASTFYFCIHRAVPTPWRPYWAAAPTWGRCSMT